MGGIRDEALESSSLAIDDRVMGLVAWHPEQSAPGQAGTRARSCFSDRPRLPAQVDAMASDHREIACGPPVLGPMGGHRGRPFLLDWNDRAGHRLAGCTERDRRLGHDNVQLVRLDPCSGQLPSLKGGWRLLSISAKLWSRRAGQLGSALGRGSVSHRAAMQTVGLSSDLGIDLAPDARSEGFARTIRSQIGTANAEAACLTNSPSRATSLRTGCRWPAVCFASGPYDSDRDEWN